LGAGNYVVNKTTLETDLKKDGTVNILDIFAVAWDFGKTV
jgi:hypothetical protein